MHSVHSTAAPTGSASRRGRVSWRVDDPQNRVGRPAGAGARMRRWIGLLLAFALLITLADYVAWRLALGRMQAGLQTLLADMRAGGWHVHCSAPETGGWPLSATLAVSDVHAEGGTWGVPGGVAWSAERLVLTIALTDPRHLSVSPQGEETLRISHIPAVAFSADRIDIRVPLGEGRPDHASPRRRCRGRRPEGFRAAAGRADRAAFGPTACQAGQWRAERDPGFHRGSDRPAGYRPLAARRQRDEPHRRGGAHLAAGPPAPTAAARRRAGATAAASSRSRTSGCAGARYRSKATRPWGWMPGCSRREPATRMSSAPRPQSTPWRRRASSGRAWP